MTRRTAVAATWLATVMGAVALVAASRYSGTGLLGGGGFSVVFAGLGFDVVVYATVGAILATRRPGNRVGLLLRVAGALIAATFLGFIAGALLTAERGDDDTLAGLVALVGALGIYPTLILAGPALAFVFPDGHLPGPRWRWPVGAIAGAVIGGTALVLVAPGPIGDSLASNPLGVTEVPWLEAASALGAGLAALALPAALVVALAAIVVRFRRARGVERQQLKWFVAANILVATFLMLSVADGATEPTVFDVLAVYGLALPLLRSGSRSSATASTRSTGSSAAPSGGRWSPGCSWPCSRHSSSGSRACSPGSRRARPWRWRLPRSSPSRSSSRYDGGSSAPSTTASTGPGTTAIGSWLRSRSACGPRWTWVA